MANVPIPPEMVKDPWELNLPGQGLGRDPERTPMQWDASPRAGFSTVEPWLPVASNFAEVNVEAQSSDPRSMLSFFRALTTLRRDTPALEVGSYATVPLPAPQSSEVFAYLRRYEGKTVLVVLNFTNRTQIVDLAGVEQGFVSGEVLLSTEMDRQGNEPLDHFALRPNEGVVIAL
jgi:alpha-glucosidase